MPSLEQLPSPDEAAFQRAEALLLFRRPEAALEIAGPLLAARPDDARTCALVARCQLAAGAHADAVASVRRTLALAAASSGVLVWASDVLSTAGQRNAALDLAQEAVRLAPQSAEAHIAVATLAASLAPKGDPSCLDHFLWQQARRHAQEAMRLDPAGSAPIFAHAYVNMRSGQNRAARQGFRAVLAVNPTSDGARNNLAILEMRRMRLVRAARALAGLVVEDPGSRMAVRNVARVLCRQLALGHALYLVLYVSAVAAAAVGPAGRLHWQWSSRSTIVVTAMTTLAALVARTWGAAAPGLRSFAARRLFSRGEARTVAGCDLLLTALLLGSAVSTGTPAWGVPAAGLVLAVPVTVVLQRASSRHPR